MPFLTAEFVSIAARELVEIAKAAREAGDYVCAAQVDSWATLLGSCSCTTELVQEMAAAFELNASAAERRDEPRAKLAREMADVLCEEVAQRLLLAELTDTWWTAEAGRWVAGVDDIARRREAIRDIGREVVLRDGDHDLGRICEMLGAPSDRAMVRIAAGVLAQRAAKPLPPAERERRTTVPCPPPDAELEETVDAEAAVSSERPTVVVHGEDVVEMVEAAAWTR